MEKLWSHRELRKRKHIDPRPAPSLRPVFLASLWGYVVLFIAWNLATDPSLANYLQLAAPFTIAMLGLLSSSLRMKIVLLWIAAAGASLVSVLLVFSGLGMLTLPIVAIYLWTAWRLNESAHDPAR